MRALIVGEGKSGTTALLRSLSNAMAEPTELFEPQLMTPADLEPDPLVVKKLLLNWSAPENDLLDRFDKRVFIVRDPRDRLVSHLLYDAYNKADGLNAKKREKWLAILARKTKTPQKISMTRLINVWWRLSRTDLVSHYVRAQDRSNGFDRRLGSEFFTLRYEDYVDGHFSAVNDYLGMDLSPGVVKSTESRVVRSSTHGEWRRWFTPEDVRVFRPLSHHWLKKHGYDHRDWQLEKSGELNPATTTEYVASLFERRPLPASPPDRS